MTQSSQPSEGENTYVIADTAAEMARLILQDQILTRAMGGLIPPGTDLSKARRVLDVACGPGGWALELARAYPDLQVVGIDISSRMIDYATSQAEDSGLDNISFLVMDALEPLDFPDGYFDLVNARYISGFVSLAAWPRFLEGIARVTVPGGVACITDGDIYSISTGPAFEKLSGFFAKAMLLEGHYISPDGVHTYITPMIGPFLQGAGYQNIKKKSHVIDWSPGMQEHETIYQNWVAVLKLLQPFLIKKGVTTQGEADRLYREAVIEMLSDDFSALWYFLSVWCNKS
jgi:ubiquinone/menaquinone biosynthesis C-methylase UbiE